MPTRPRVLVDVASARTGHPVIDLEARVVAFDPTAPIPTDRVRGLVHDHGYHRLTLEEAEALRDDLAGAIETARRLAPSIALVRASRPAELELEEDPGPTLLDPDELRRTVEGHNADRYQAATEATEARTDVTREGPPGALGHPLAHHNGARRILDLGYPLHTLPPGDGRAGWTAYVERTPEGTITATGPTESAALARLGVLMVDAGILPPALAIESHLTSHGFRVHVAENPTRATLGLPGWIARTTLATDDGEVSLSADGTDRRHALEALAVRLHDAGHLPLPTDPEA